MKKKRNKKNDTFNLPLFSKQKMETARKRLQHCCCDESFTTFYYTHFEITPESKMNFSNDPYVDSGV